jgi:hypothetical protein
LHVALSLVARTHSTYVVRQAATWAGTPPSALPLPVASAEVVAAVVEVVAGALQAAMPLTAKRIGANEYTANETDVNLGRRLDRMDDGSSRAPWAVDESTAGAQARSEPTRTETISAALAGSLLLELGARGGQNDQPDALQNRSVTIRNNRPKSAPRTKTRSSRTPPSCVSMARAPQRPKTMPSFE